MNNKKILVFVPFAIFVVLFLLAWTGREVDLKDPWYRAVGILEEGRKEKDPELSAKLIDSSGRMLDDLLEKYPFHARVHFFKGFYFITKKNWDSAIVELKITIDKGKGGTVNQVEFQASKMLVNATINRANEMMKQKKIQHGINLMQDILEYAPRSVNLWNHAAYFHQSIQQLDSAIVYYNKALQIDPNFKPSKQNLVGIYKMYGNYYINLNKLAIARQYFERSLRIMPKDADLHNNLANVLLKLGNAKKAVEHFEKAVKINPNNQSFKGNLAIAKRRLPA
jgi:tetratricopeptide (TPR) repeat protein